MEQTTFAKKTVVLAALGALSLMAATVRAADETETEPTTSVNIAVEIGGTGATSIGSNVETSVTWNDEWLKKEGVLGANESFGGLTVKGNTNVNTITVTEKGSLTIDLPTQEAPDEEAAKVVTFDSVNLSVKDGGTFKNSSHVNFQNGSLTVAGAEFNNGKDGVIAFEGTTFSIDAGFSLDAEDKDTLGNFENAGLIRELP